MTVRAVDMYNHDRSAFPTVLTGTVLGMGVGYIARNELPVTPSENNFNIDTIKTSSYKIANRNMVQDIKTAAAKAQGLTEYKPGTKLNLSLAQDEFVKMIENKKGNKGFLAESIEKTAEALEKKVPGAGKEYKEIIAKANESASKNANRLINACKIMIKGERPLAGFLIPGAIVGMAAGIIVNAFRDSRQA